MLTLTIIIAGLLVLALLALGAFVGFVFLGERVAAAVPLGLPGKCVLLMLRSLRRNSLRTSLTYLAVFVLVVVVTAVWSVLNYLEDLMHEKTRDIKVIVSEKWSASSHLPFAYAQRICEGAADPSRPSDARPLDSMTWQFYVGTSDPAKKTRESFVILIGLEPVKLLTMMDELLSEITPGQRQFGLEAQARRELEAGVAKMHGNKQGIIIGRKRLETIQRRVGDRFRLYGLNYAGLDLEFEIVGVLPASGRYDEAAFMNRDYLNDALQAYARAHAGVKHPMADRSLDVVWLKVADQEQYGRIAAQIEGSSYFHNPPIKCETLSSAVATVLQSYREIMWGMRWLLSPAILITMTLVVANAVSFSVRERRTELAVLKVLGFRPVQILGLVLGEAVLIGTVSGLFSTALCYVLINVPLRESNPMPVAVPAAALLWGPALGGLTALAGSLLPAWNACRVQASEVFARVA